MKTSTLVALFCLLFMMSCAPLPREREIHLVWPNPPDPPRIKYLGAFSSPGELGITTPWYRKLHRAITGKKEKRVKLGSPYHIFVDRQGDVYVTDTLAPSLHLFRRSTGKYKEIVSGSGIKIYSPIGIAVDNRGRIFVADSILDTVLVLSGKGKHLFTIDSDHFERPTGIALDRESGTLYVVDTLGHNVRCFDLEGNFVKAIGKRGTGPGEFNFPTCICVDRKHRVYVGDSMNFRIQVFDKGGNYLAGFGQAGDGTGYFSKIKGVAVDSLGHIYVSDAQFDVVQVFDLEGNFLLTIGEPGRGPGQFRFPAGIYIDENDIIYIVDKLNQRVQMFTYMKAKEKDDT